MTTTRHAPVSCKCGYVMDSTSAVDGHAVPGPGDVTLCIKCGAVYVFGASMELTDAPASVLEDPDVERVRRAIREIQ